MSKFIDRRNPDPIINRSNYSSDNGLVSFYDERGSGPILAALSIVDRLTSGLDCSLPSPALYGYTYNQDCQPYHLELWVEKTTMNDVLEPICREYNANLVTAAGFQSISNTLGLIERVKRTGKPTRIFYIFDFDPAGDGMSIAVARQIQFWAKCDLDIALDPLVLTHGQTLQYRLPRILIKETDKRRNGFEERFGAGATELDALEALYPGELGKIVRRALDAYYDYDLRDKYRRVGDAMNERVQDAWEAEIKDDVARIKQLKQECIDRLKAYEPVFKEIRWQVIEPIRREIEKVWQAIKNKRDAFKPNLDPVPESLLPGQLAFGDEPLLDTSRWLYDSRRNFLEQTSAFKKQKQKLNGTL